jgi:hypothetical protein
VGLAQSSQLKSIKNQGAASPVLFYDEQESFALPRAESNVCRDGPGRFFEEMFNLVVDYQIFDRLYHREQIVIVHSGALCNLHFAFGFIGLQTDPWALAVFEAVAFREGRVL